MEDEAMRGRVAPGRWLPAMDEAGMDGVRQTEGVERAM